MQFLAVFSTLVIYLLVTPHFVNPFPAPVTQKNTTAISKAEISDKKELGKAEAPHSPDKQGDPLSKPGDNDDLDNDVSLVTTKSKAVEPSLDTNGDKNNVAAAGSTEKSAIHPNESEAGGEPSLDTNNGTDNAPSATIDDKNNVADAETTEKPAVAGKTQEPPMDSDDGNGDDLDLKNITTEKTGDLVTAVNTQNDYTKSPDEPEKSTNKSDEVPKIDTPDQSNGVNANPQPDDKEETDELNSVDEAKADTGVVGNPNEKVPSDDKENEGEPAEKTSTETIEKSDDGNKTVDSDGTEAPKIPPPTEVAKEGGESPGNESLVISLKEPKIPDAKDTEENPADTEGDTNDALDDDLKNNFDETGGEMDVHIMDDEEGYEYNTINESPVEHEVGNSDVYEEGFMEGEEHSKGHFFAFILTAMFFTAAVYLLYHNKRKVVALVMPGAQRRTGMRHRAGYKANYDRLENKQDWR